MVVEIGMIVGVLSVLWVLLDLETYRERALRVGRALHLAEPATPRPAGPPIERIAADAQRIRAQIGQAPQGMPVARLRGWWEAYDDVLVDACQALSLEERLSTLPESTERDVERVRVERLLGGAGFPVRPSA